MDKDNFLKRNLFRPPVKDSVSLPVFGYTIIRFYADNPGTWMFHCHLEMHPESGQQLLIRVGTAKDLPKIPKNWPKCGNFKLA